MPRPLPLKVVHINRRTLAANIKNGSREPVVTARRKYGQGLMRSNKIHILDAHGDIAATIVNADEILQPGRGRQTEAAAMFVDMRGFTRLATQLEPRLAEVAQGDGHERVVALEHPPTHLHRLREQRLRFHRPAQPHR